MKLAFVPPRYGPEVIGGAEHAIRMTAEHAAALGDEVEVFTTCALEATTWADSYEAGSTEINGVTVNRFASRSGRDPGFGRLCDELLPLGRRAKRDGRFVDMQGPVCPSALDAAAESDADLVVFSPYLYWPAVRGIQRLGERAVLHAAAHDEAPLYLPIYKSVVERPRALVFYTEAERSLTQRMFDVEALPQLLFGLGIEAPATVSTDGAAQAHLGLGNLPYLLCLGRVDDGKGVGLLANAFAAYKQLHPGPLALVFAGPPVHPPAPHPDIHVAGLVDEATKWSLLHGATALVNPSPHESFSIVLLEAWSQGIPVVVNGVCAATREHCRRSSGGLWFRTFDELAVIIARLESDAALRTRLGQAGRAYVDDHFAWPSLIRRYRRFLSSLVA